MSQAHQIVFETADMVFRFLLNLFSFLAPPWDVFMNMIFTFAENTSDKTISVEAKI